MKNQIERIKKGQREIDTMVQAAADSKKAEAVQSGAAGEQLSVYVPAFDGAFDPEKYGNSSVKILFIANEPNLPGDGGWDYGGTPAMTGSTVSVRRGSPPDKNHFFGLMNAIANGIINHDFSSGWNPDNNSPLYSTALISISNLPGEAHTGLRGNMSRLYKDNREILEKKLSVYSPDITVCHNTADTIWDSLRKELAFDHYRVKYFDIEGKELPLGENNEPAEAPAAAVYYCDNKKIVIDIFRAAYQIRDGNLQEAWIAGVVNSFRPVLSPAPAARSKIPFVIIAAIILLLLLLLLRLCKASDAVPAAPAKPAAPAPATEAAPLPPPIFSEVTEAVFARDSSALLPSAAAWLDELARELARHIEQNPSASFRITGYTAIFPGPPDPIVLSLERAEQIVAELSVRGIAPDKLEAAGGGETDRWGTGADENSRKSNRRIVIVQK